MDKTRIPVLVGTAQLTDNNKTEQQIDPVSFMSQVSRMALKDAAFDDSLFSRHYIYCKLLFQKSTNTIDLVKILGMNPSKTGYTGIGGSAPQWFVNHAA